ncbi:hypothetical protein [Hymenobacter armeniacus]|uniref:hypothetical protein n=1 Tax=Hymenobacter armeniacus TaxID=2771358 RepID=UPI001687E0B5|nr:hypothetical protein [Hymenobacter armeniacus]
MLTLPEQYNSLDLLQTSIALAILPENHGKILRLEVLINSILAHFDASQPIAPEAAVRQFLANEYGSYDEEDVLTTPFTDVVPFFGGDYLVLPGATEGGSYVLNNLITAIFHWNPDRLPTSFQHNCRVAVQFLLRLSQLVISRLQYTRYQTGSTEHDEVAWPEADRLQQAREAVLISEDDMRALLAPDGLAPSVPAVFSATVAVFQAAIAAGQNPLLQKPLLRLASDYMVVSPLSICHILTEFIWAQARRYDCVAELNRNYQQVVWRAVHQQLTHMGFRYEDMSAQLPAISPNTFRGVYRFDTDKLAYAHLAYSSRSGERVDLTTATEDEGAERQAIVAALLALPQYTGHQVLDFLFASLDGSDLMLPLRAVPGTYPLVISTHEVATLYTMGEAEALDLWKFAMAEHERQTASPLPAFHTSLLDNFKFYRQHDDSFYVSDETRPNYLFIPPGYAADWLTRAKQQTDEHSALVTAHGPYAGATLVVQRYGTFGSTYASSEDALRSELRFLVDGFAQPVWVETTSISPAAGSQLRHSLFELTDAIAYWLDQVRDDLRPYLAHEQLPSIHVVFECQPVAAFEAEHPSLERVADLASYFQTGAAAEEARLLIPAELIAYLYGADNAGEQVLVEHLLVALSKLLVENGLPAIPVDAQQAMLAMHVPLGQKKKILLLNSADNLLLDPRDLVAKRTVQEYDTGRVLDALVPALEAQGLCPPVGDIEDQDAKEKLTRDVVMRVLLPQLSRTIARYDQRDLLGKLLALNERLIHDREFLRVQTPSRIACFVEIAQQVADVKESLNASSRTSVAVRCLIEHISAEQMLTGIPASTTERDELVALMDQIIAWGSLGDQLKHRLFDTKIGILPTYRIGTEKTFSNDVLDPYYTAKTHEDVIDAVRYYEQVFPQQQQQTGEATPAALDRAFTQDYAISFTRICEFIEALVRVALEAEQSVVALPKSALRLAIERVGLPFEAAEFEAVLTYLTLTKRTSVATIPRGYDSFDISPWRFNRRLSLLRKPLVAFHNETAPDDPIIYWGFRQVLLSRRNWGSQIHENRFRVTQGSAVDTELGSIASRRGTILVRKVEEWLQGENRVVRTEVLMNSIAQTTLDPDLGDIDVLVIDLISRVVYSIECKYMAPSRNMHEMAQELDKLFGSDGWVPKHVRRHEWLDSHLTELGRYCGLDLQSFVLHSLIVTAEDMLTPYLRTREMMLLPFVTLYEIEREGLVAIQQALNG